MAGKRFWEKSEVDSSATLWVTNFVEITLSRSVSEINAFLCLMQKFKMATKSGEKIFFEKISAVESPASLWVKNLVKIALCGSVSVFNAEIQDGRQNRQENNFCCH